MLPRLQAEEQLSQFNLGIAHGGMGMDEEGRSKFMRSLEQSAVGHKVRSDPRGMLIGAGVQVKTEPGKNG